MSRLFSVSEIQRCHALVLPSIARIVARNQRQHFPGFPALMLQKYNVYDVYTGSVISSMASTFFSAVGMMLINPYSSAMMTASKISIGIGIGIVVFGAIGIPVAYQTLKIADKYVTRNYTDENQRLIQRFTKEPTVENYLKITPLMSKYPMIFDRLVRKTINDEDVELILKQK